MISVVRSGQVCGDGCFICTLSYRLCMARSSLFAKLVAFRIVNACLVQTFFQPDEFFQSLEVAHRIVFGYGWETWEWRADSRLRSPLHALLFVPGYAAVKWLGLEETSAPVSVQSRRHS